MASAINLKSAANNTCSLSFNGSADMSVDASTLNSLIGVGQTWQNVTASRTLSTQYTNSTGKPIIVSIGITTAAAGNMTIIVNGVSTTLQGTTVSSGQGIGCITIVPNGSTYQCNASGTPSLNIWSELR